MIANFFRRHWPSQLVFTLTAAIYARTLTADFLRWDDRQNILLNPWIERNNLAMIWSNRYYNMYIPVTYTFWDALWAIAPNQPLQFHLANILLHSINAVLVYALARLVLGQTQRTGAILAALVFALHPLQVESVAWISTGRDLLAGLFSLTATYILLTRVRATWMVATVGLFAAACFSKPSVAIVPVAVALIAWWTERLNSRRAITLGAWLVPAAVATLITKHIQQLDADLRLTPMNLLERTMVALDSLEFYAQKIFLPFPLAADYGRTREMALADYKWLGMLLVILAFGAVASKYRHKLDRRYAVFAGLFAILLLPVLGIVPFQAQAQTTVADRYVYFAMIGAGLLLGSAFANAPGRARVPVLTAGLASMIALSTLTFKRAGVWATNEVFFTDMLAKNEKSHVALSSLGVEYILTGRLVEAEAMLNRAVVLKPVDVIPRTNLAQLYLLLNRPDRVVAEVLPLLNDREFLRVNQTETRALASAYRLTARATWGMDFWTRANDFYCRWYRLDYENEEGKAEVQRFAQDARQHGAPLKDCDLSARNDP